MQRWWQLKGYPAFPRAWKDTSSVIPFFFLFLYKKKKLNKSLPLTYASVNPPVMPSSPLPDHRQLMVWHPDL
jgi:hypothetical protein